jgi:hypothetical protein
MTISSLAFGGYSGIIYANKDVFPACAEPQQLKHMTGISRTLEAASPIYMRRIEFRRNGEQTNRSKAARVGKESKAGKDKNLECQGSL